MAAPAQQVEAVGVEGVREQDAGHARPAGPGLKSRRAWPD
jgi:hypothetical protein